MGYLTGGRDVGLSTDVFRESDEGFGGGLGLENFLAPGSVGSVPWLLPNDSLRPPSSP